MTLGERIRSVRGKISQADFAAKIGVSSRTLGYYEAGKRVPDATTIMNICAEAGVEPNWLLGAAEQADRIKELQHENEDLHGQLMEKGMDPGRDFIVPVYRFIDPSSNTWKQLTNTRMYALCPVDVFQSSGFAVLMGDSSLQWEGIREGSLLFCDPKEEPRNGDLLFIERTNGLAAIRRLKDSDPDWIFLEDWGTGISDIPADMPKIEKLNGEDVKRYVVVTYVKRRQ